MANRRRGSGRAVRVVGAVLGVAGLMATFAAYLNPSFMVEFGGFMSLCAQWVGLR